MYIFTAAYGISLGPVGWVLPSEVFPLSMRSKGVALSTASNWANNCVFCPSSAYRRALMWQYSFHRSHDTRYDASIAYVRTNLFDFHWCG